MSRHSNELGQPVGWPVQDWTRRPRPPRTPMTGRYGRLELLDLTAHGDELWSAFSADGEGRVWSYLPIGPFADRAGLDDWLGSCAVSEDPLFHAVIDGATGKAVGYATYLRIEPAVGVIEVGHITFSPAMQRSRLSTEVMYLMMRRVFDELGYRRYEWKCDSLNAPSKAAAGRLGFQYEGLFRQATIYKGRNRDTAWFSILDSEWPRLRDGFERWLAPDNFDADNRQRASLSELTG